MYVNKFADIPFTVLSMLTSVVNYGGRINDDKDMRTADIIIADFLTPEILADSYKFSRSGIYKTISTDSQKGYLEYIDSLPMMPEPEVFGMHGNAMITYDLNESDSNCEIILSLQPRTSGGGGVSREDVMGDAARDMESRLPPVFDPDDVYLRSVTQSRK